MSMLLAGPRIGSRSLWFLLCASWLTTPARAQLTALASTESANQLAVAEAVEAAIQRGESADLVATQALLLAADPAVAQAGLQQMSGEIRAGTISALGLKDGLFLGRILGQMHGLHSDPNGPPPEVHEPPGRESAPAVNAPSSSLYQWLNGAIERPRFGPWYVHGDHQFWAFASGYSGEVDSAPGNEGFEYSGSGGVLGYTYRWSDRVRTGLHIGVSTTTVDAVTTPGTTNEVTSGNLGGQISFMQDGNYMEVVAGMAENDFESSRVLQFAGIDRVAAAEYGGRQAYLYLELGQTYELGDLDVPERWHFEPQLAVQSQTYSTEAYVETGADGLNLVAPENDLSFFQTALGGRFFYTNLTASGEWIIPDIVIRWAHEFGDIERTAPGSFAGTTPIFTTSARPADADVLQLRLGVTTQTRESWTFDFSYNADLSDGYLAQAGTAKGVWRF